MENQHARETAATEPEDRNPAASLIGQEVDADRLRLLIKQSYPGAYFGFAMGAIWSWVIIDYASTHSVLLWLGILLLTTLARLGLARLYFRPSADAQQVRRRARPYLASLYASALIWGAGTVLIMPNALPAHTITLCVLTGLAGAILASYSAYRPAAVGSMLMIMLPITLWLYSRQDKLHVSLAIGATIFIYVTLRGAKILSHALMLNLLMGHELKQAHEVADRQAKTDALTGINNRRAFFELGEQIASYCERNALPLSAIMLDVDHFKRINDTKGHHFGDLTLRQIGALLAREFRKSDLVGRLGGEEFAVLLPDTALEHAHALAEKLRAVIAATPIALGDQQLQVTASLGVAVGEYRLESLLPKADAAMYQAKTLGRNQTVSAN
ncbi:MAG TPA: GGDEF domain-containing protein [Gallionellaceae bacterium]|nr:GGDEF domain-containing protein [Gallionellaceae bacterium]